MKGDILIIDDKHRKAARQALALLEETLRKHDGTFFITVAGESGAGKSETAAALAEAMEEKGLKTHIIQQDDFFKHPPKTNAAIRVKTGGDVGPQEVRMDLLNQIVRSIRSGDTLITKPLVIFEEDRIISEQVDTSPFKVIIIEGTYTTLLENIDSKVFIDRNVEDTRSDRLKRNREKQDEFLEKILLTEHNIIIGHKPLADIIITREYDAVNNTIAYE